MENQASRFVVYGVLLHWASHDFCIERLEDLIEKMIFSDNCREKVNDFMKNLIY